MIFYTYQDLSYLIFQERLMFVIMHSFLESMNFINLGYRGILKLAMQWKFFIDLKTSLSSLFNIGVRSRNSHAIVKFL